MSVDIRFSTDINYAHAPILKIDHNGGIFRMNERPVSEARLGRTILLGAIRQRIFTGDFSEGSPLYCRSKNFSDGYPTEAFPADKSGFPLSYVEDARSETGQPLSCGSCAFNVRGGKSLGRTRLVCVEQITIPTMVPREEDGAYELAIAHYQRSSLAAARNYMRRMAPDPLYLRFTKMKLGMTSSKNASGEPFTYATPTFQEGEALDESYIMLLENLYHHVKTSQQRKPPPVGKRNAPGGFFAVAGAEAPETPLSYNGGFF